LTPSNSYLNAFELGSNILTHFIIPPEMQDSLPSVSREQVDAADIEATPVKNNPATSKNNLFIAHFLF